MEYNKKPQFYNASIRLKDQFSLYVDIDSQDNVRDIGYEVKSDLWGAKLEKFASERIGLKYFSDPDHSTDSNVLVCIWRDLIKNFTGDFFVPLAKKENLLCRCFAKSFDEVERSFKENFGDLKEVVKSLKVGTGCSSCLTQLRELENQYRQHQDKFQEISNYEWITRFDKVFKSIQSDMYFQIISFSKGLLKVRISGDRQAKSRDFLSESLLEEIKKNYDVDIKISVVF